MNRHKRLQIELLDTREEKATVSEILRKLRHRQFLDYGSKQVQWIEAKGDPFEKDKLHVLPLFFLFCVGG